MFHCFRTVAELAPLPPPTRPWPHVIPSTADHPAFTTHGYPAGLVKEFGVGRSRSRKYLPGRLVIPVHNEEGDLCGYVGRTVPSVRRPRPARLEYLGELEGVVFNLHRLRRDRWDDCPVKLVAGPFEALHLAGHGITAVAGLMGGQGLRELQLRRLLHLLPHAAFVLLFDENERGRDLRDDIALRLGRYASVRSLEFADEGRTVESLTADEIKEVP